MGRACARRGRRLLASLIVLGVVGTGAEAWATFDSTATASHPLSTAVLAPPSDTQAHTSACSTLLLTATAMVSWTATPSSWANGYEVLTSGVSGGPYSVAAAVDGVATTSAEVPSVALGSTIYVVVRAVKDAWQSPTTTEISYTAPVLCL